MAYITSGCIGVDVDSTSAGTTTDGANAQFTLGQTETGPDGTKYMYVQAAEEISTATTTPYFLAIDENFQASKITKALASAGYFLGVAPALVIADNAFFWARMTGSNFNCKVAVSCAADTALWTTATAGVLDDTSGGSHVRVNNVVIVTAASTSASAGSTVREAVISGGGMFNPGLIA